MEKLVTYSALKEQLTSTLHNIRKVVRENAPRQTLDDIGRRIEENRFSLIVAGQFKRGKTTFINSLLGSDLLPVAIIPVTSIITIISYGEELVIDLYFQDGGRREISRDELPLYITEKHNPQNRKNVDRVEILYPSPYLKNHVQLIDTPGVASIHSHNTETTYGYLPKADAAIFLVSVDPPLTEAEFHFLNDLKGYAARIFFVQNKIDTVSETDRLESLAFTRSVIEEQLGFEEAGIFPLSARNALEGKLSQNAALVEKSGLPPFESMLEEFLMAEKGSVILLSAANKIQNIIAQEAFSSRLMEQSLKEPLSDLEEKIGIFEEARQEIEVERSDTKMLVREEANRLINDVLLQDLEALKKDKTRELLAETNDVAGQLGGLGNREFAAAMDEFLRERIHDIFNEWRLEEEDRIEKHLGGILQRLVGRTNRVIDRLIEISSQVFGAGLGSFSVDESLEGDSSFSFKIDEDVKVALESITEAATLLLPRKLAHRIILGETRERAANLVDRHCGRLRHDLTGRIEETVEDFRQRLDGVVASTIRSIEEALASGRRARRQSAEELEAFENELAERLGVLDQASEELRRLESSLAGAAL